MAFDWREYLNVAEFLRGRKSDCTQEAAYRCAVSRAYYAAFCHARNYARDRLTLKPTYSHRDHELVRIHFRNCRMPNIDLKLRQLSKWRNTCDYDDTIRNISLMPAFAISEAQQVIDML